MPVLATDAFTGSSGSLLHGRTTTTGGKVWAGLSRFAGTLNNTATLSASNTLSISSFGVYTAWVIDLGAANHYAKITLSGTPGDHPRGLAVRVVDDYNFLCLRPFSASYWALTKVTDASGSLAETNLAIFDTSAAGGALPASGRQIYLQAEGSNPTILKPYVASAEGGTLVQLGDAGGYAVSDAIFQTSTKVGIGGPGAAIGFDNFEAGSLAAADSITIVSPLAVMQRATSGPTSVAFSGSYTGSPTSIEARIVSAATGLPLAGLDWATAVASPSGGSYSFSRSIPAGRNYRCEVRFGNATSVAAQTGGRWGVGPRGIIFGQSHAAAMGDGALAALADVYNFTDGTFIQTTEGGTNSLANTLSELASVPVAIHRHGIGGQTLQSLMTGTNWSNFVANVDGAAATGGFEVVWVFQGEAEAGGTRSEAERLADLEQLQTQMETVAGRAVIIIIIQIGRETSGTLNGTAEDDQWQLIRRSDHSKCTTDPAFRLGAHTIALGHSNSLHLDTANVMEAARRAGRTAAAALFAVATHDGLGPKPQGASLTGGTITVSFDLNGHSALTGSGALTGWQRKTGGVWVTVTDAARVGNSVQFAGPAGTTHVRHLALINPDVSNVVRGDLKATAASAATIEAAPTTLGPLAVTSDVTGGSSVTLGSLTGAAAGAVRIGAASAGQAGAISGSAQGGVTAAGASSQALGGVGGAAEGDVIADGDSSAALGAVGGAAAGAVRVGGASDLALGGIGGSATGVIVSGLAGASSQTIGAIGGAAQGSVVVAGLSVRTLDGIGGTAAGGVTVAGASSWALGGIGGTATGVLVSGLAGGSSQTLGGIGGSGAAAVRIAALSSASPGALAGSAAGAVAVAGGSGLALGAIGGAAAGVIISGLAGASSAPLAGVGGAAQGGVVVSGLSAQALDGIGGAAAGLVVTGGRGLMDFGLGDRRVPIGRRPRRVRQI